MYSNPDDKLEYYRLWRLRNKDHSKQRRKDRRAVDLAVDRKRKYGVAQEEFDHMFHGQDGCCAICLAPLVGGPRPVNVDHDHDTGLVRGLLCLHCNTALGHFRDSPDICRAAADYLEYSQ